MLWTKPLVLPVLLITENQLFSLHHGTWKEARIRHTSGPISLLGGGCSNDSLLYTVQGEGNVQSLLTMQSGSGRATMLRSFATSEMSPVQLNQPTAGAHSPQGAMPFATGAWLQPTKLTQAAGMSISLPSTRLFFLMICQLWDI